jgi:hypothetical protein
MSKTTKPKGKPDPAATKAVHGMLQKLGLPSSTPVKIGPYQRPGGKRSK